MQRKGRLLPLTRPQRSMELCCGTCADHWEKKSSYQGPIQAWDGRATGNSHSLQWQPTSARSGSLARFLSLLQTCKFPSLLNWQNSLGLCQSSQDNFGEERCSVVMRQSPGEQSETLILILWATLGKVFNLLGLHVHSPISKAGMNASALLPKAGVMLI